MKTLHWLVVVVFSVSLVVSSGCSRFKRSKNQVATRGQQSTKTSGFSDEDGFGESTSSTSKSNVAHKQTYRFDFNSFEVKPYDVELISLQAEYLANNSNARVRLEGNTDERGSREYNVALGWKRARAVSAILKEYGIIDDQIVIVSYGKEKPVAFGHDENSYSQNRRVELVYEVK